MFEKEAEEFVDSKKSFWRQGRTCIDSVRQAYQQGALFGYNKANEWHSPNEHINKDRVVLGYIKHCNKKRYSLVQWNGEWWYQYGTYNAEVKLIAWCDVPEPPKEIE